MKTPSVDNSSGTGPRHPDPTDVLFVSKLIRRKARQLVGPAGCGAFDRDDIEQDLQLKIVSQQGAFDPQRGHYRAFVTAVVERYAATIARNRGFKKRAGAGIRSLSIVIGLDEFGQPVELAATVSDEANDLRLGRKSRSAQEQNELSQDIAAMLGELSDEDREIAARLMHASIAQVARELNIAPSTLYDKIRRIRQRFEDASLREYL